MEVNHSDQVTDRLWRVLTRRENGAKLKEIALAENLTTERARQLVSQAKRLREFWQQVPDTFTSETPIANIPLSVRLHNICHVAGINVLGDLAQLSERDLLMRKNCGRGTVAEARQWMSKAGLAFRATETAHCPTCTCAHF